MSFPAANNERQAIRLVQISKASLCLVPVMVVVLFLLPSVSTAQTDPDMANLIGKLQDMMATNVAKAAGTNQAMMLAPPLPEIPPTAWERYGWIVWLVLPFVVMVIGIVAAFLLRARKPPVLFSPATEARAALASLHARPTDGKMLSQISRTLRRYLVAAFWLEAGEMTTTEFCAVLANNAQIGAELSGKIAQFLRACDELKFSPGNNAPPMEAVPQAMLLVDLAEARRAAGPAAPSA